MTPQQVSPFSRLELEAERGTLLPTKEVLSLLNLNAQIDLALDLVAPVDLAVGANLNVALPIDAAVSANVLSVLSESTAAAQQQVMITQDMTGVDAIAFAPQTSDIDQGNDTVDSGSAAPAPTTDGGTTAPTTGVTAPTDSTGGVTAPSTGGLLGPTDGLGSAVGDVAGSVSDALASGILAGNLLNVDVDVAADLDLAAPIAGAVAANANVAAPIDAAVSANVLSVGSTSVALATQTAVISQTMTDVVANATADQTSTIVQ